MCVQDGPQRSECQLAGGPMVEIRHGPGKAGNSGIRSEKEKIHLMELSRVLVTGFLWGKGSLEN